MFLLARKKYYLIFLILLSSGVSSQENLVVSSYASLFELSLQEILSMRVEIGNLTATQVNKSPAAITIISRDQIQRTPARNILDLIEVYVPGVLLMSHLSSGPRLRIRGMGERHYHTLLLVNGKPVNEKAFQGSMVELRNWDLSDIERVEVVRGPGSVTHGPGAIAGVINIITRKATAEDGVEVGLDYNHTYDSRAIKISHAGNMAGADTFFHVSYTRTKGVEDVDLYQLLGNGGLGYKGTDDFSGAEANPLQAYYADFDDEPQIKLYGDINLDNWRFWFRYNNSGQTNTSAQKEIQGEFQDWRSFQNRYYILTLENKLELSDRLNLNSRVTFDSEDYMETKAKQATLSNTHELNRSYGFSVDEINLRSTLNFLADEDLSWATAFEFSQDSIGAPWGEPSGSFLASAGGQFFIEKDSVYDGGEDGGGGTIKSSKVAEYTDGWSSNTYSVSTELKYQLAQALQLTASARVDKNDFTKYMTSPRIAVLYEFNDENILKLSWQKALRMNTILELYWLDLNDLEQEPEHITTTEITYSRLHNENLHFSFTTFYNDSEVYAWDSSGNNASLVGTIEAYGLEPELAYRTETISFGINHSFFELLDWDYLLKAADGSSRQDVSYSDVYNIKDYLTRTSTGNSLNYWANQHSKLFFDMNINDSWSVHVDARIIWEYEYGNDLFKMYNNAFADVDVAALSADDLADYNEAKDWLDQYNEALDDKDAYGKDIRLNASITWDLLALNASLMLYGQNLINFTDNKRQKSLFVSKTLPFAAWVEEPRMIGLRYSQKF